MAAQSRKWTIVRVPHGDPEVLAATLAEVDEFELSPQANGDVLVLFKTSAEPAPAEVPVV